MAGFDIDKAGETYLLPENYEPVAAIALGYPAEEDVGIPSRMPQRDFVFGGKWGESL